MEDTYTIRKMQIEDYDKIHRLWLTIHGFGIRSIDDSREGIGRFIRRNPTTCIVAEQKGGIIGTILCGHDGRTGCFYHVCVDERFRKHGVGKAMTLAAMQALKEEHINKVSLIAFSDNALGNQFWQEMGWVKRDDFNYYEFVLNEANLTRFNQ